MSFCDTRKIAHNQMDTGYPRRFRAFAEGQACYPGIPSPSQINAESLAVNMAVKARSAQPIEMEAGQRSIFAGLGLAIIFAGMIERMIRRFEVWAIPAKTGGAARLRSYEQLGAGRRPARKLGYIFFRIMDEEIVGAGPLPRNMA